MKDFQGDDLDAIGITPRIWAAAKPSSGRKTRYLQGLAWGKNTFKSVKKFLDNLTDGHVKDSKGTPTWNDYLVVNVRAEKPHYEEYSFKGPNGGKGDQITDITWDDHEVPLFDSFVELLERIEKKMIENPKRVLLVHCQAGKARTGTVICAFLCNTIYKHHGNRALIDEINKTIDEKSGKFKDLVKCWPRQKLKDVADPIRATMDAITTYYSCRRMQDAPGVRRPSQKRWIWYNLRRGKMGPAIYNHRREIVWKIKRISMTSYVGKIRISRKGGDNLNTPNLKPGERYPELFRKSLDQTTRSFRQNFDREDEFDVSRRRDLRVLKLEATEPLWATGDPVNKTYQKATVVRDTQPRSMWSIEPKTKNGADILVKGDCRIEFNPGNSKSSWRQTMPSDFIHKTAFYVDFNTAFLIKSTKCRRRLNAGPTAYLTLNACQMDSQRSGFKKETNQFKIQVELEQVNPDIIPLVAMI